MHLSFVSMHHRLLGEIYTDHGKYDDALASFDRALSYADELGRREPRNAIFKLNSIYPSIGNYYVQVGDYEKARQYLEEYLDTSVKNNAASDIIAKARNDMAMMHYYAGDIQAAGELLRDAAGVNANAFVPFREDLGKSLTMLGRVEARIGDGGKAMQAWQSALNVLERKRESFVAMKVEQADVWHQFGWFHFRQGNPDEAVRAYDEAIRLREETHTHTHPNYADALKGLANVAATRDELTSATLLAGRALEILDASVVPAHPRIAPTLVALASLHTLMDKPDQTAPLNERLETILQKPLGPSKEDFVETTSFYAELLKKAGKTIAAERLEQLHIRQKDRR